MELHNVVTKRQHGRLVLTAQPERERPESDSVDVRLRAKERVDRLVQNAEVVVGEDDLHVTLRASRRRARRIRTRSIDDA